ncbi:membrane-associated tyrosine- and threonine-specific cdc2-inhibitory kinase [Tachysurus vachellii]|uniref:membrane-associated tyrosine- and threonine-specific cdc2-inhibitory kinase n=1 Tax=Tachysurus vachellii TaxID=175792 RepID=UPI00296B57AC|nr:membrane-associated tyrosine- and threonine-specific cdc2-inhibitory kinase [Tachysurus vachellii]
MAVGEETKSVGTPLPLPVHFTHAEQSFSLKKRRLPFSSSSLSSSSVSPSRPLSHLLPPRPPSKGCPPLSRVFPQRRSCWTPLSPALIKRPPPVTIYDPSKPQSFFSQCFVNLGLIGHGSFGEVYKVHSVIDGREYAVKRSAQRFRGESERARCLREALNHERLHPHPHVLGFCAAWEEAERLYIQTELCCMSLLLHAETQPMMTVEHCAWEYLCDLLLALRHLHSQGFAHLDLKPANVFLTHSGRLKLGDFGLLLELEQGKEKKQVMAEGKKENAYAQEGDPRYMAPELLRGEYGSAADIFSLGVTILELACSIEVPKGGEGWQQLRKGYLPSEFTNALSPELQHVLRLMLAPDPRDRASVEQLLSLPSIRKHRWRRQLSLRLRESWLSLLTLGQYIFSALISLLSYLNLPLIPCCDLPAPRTPPRDSWDVDGDLSVLQHSSSHSESASDDPVSLPGPLGLEHSPSSFAHRLQPRFSVGSTSTPLPACTPTHTPSQTSLNTHSPRLSPINLSSAKHSERSFEPKNLLTLFDEVSPESEP